VSDLPTLHRSLAAGGVVTTPPFEEVKANARQIRIRQARSAVVVLAVIAVLAGLSLAPPQRAARVVDSRRPPTTGDVAPDTRSGEPGGAAPTTTAVTHPPVIVADGEPTSPPTRYECVKGKNGGATGTGVTADRIRLTASAFLDGPAESIGRDVVMAWKTQIDAVNRGGGICGRTVDLRVINRAFRSMEPAEEAVGLLVTPLDADFAARLADGSVDRTGVPAVVSDGLGRMHHGSGWARSVGPPAATYARVIAEEAYRAGARTFALIHDPENTFGDESAAALRDYLGRLPGASLKFTQALDPGRVSYSNEVAAFNEKCRDGGCDAVLLSLLPDTAKQWLVKRPAMGRVRTAGYPYLLSKRFAADCELQIGSECTRIWVWSGYTPPIDDFLGDPDVAHYAQQFEEPLNPFTLSAYTSGSVLLEALKRVGPELSRERLRQVLDEMTYRSGLVSQLDWRPDSVGNPWARAVRPGESGFEDAGTGWRRDPMPGHFPR